MIDLEVQKFLVHCKKNHGKAVCFAKREDHYSFSLNGIKVNVEDLNGFFDFYWIDVPKMVIYVPIKQPRTTIIQSDMVIIKDSAFATLQHIMEYNKFKYTTSVSKKRKLIQFKIASGRFESKLDLAFESVREHFQDYRIKIEFRIKHIVVHLIHKQSSIN